MRWMFCVVTLLAAFQPLVTRAQSDGTFVVDRGALYRVRGETRTSVALPGPARAVHVAGELAYVALGELGVAVIRVSTASGAEVVTVEQRIPVSHGEVTGFMVEGESVWMQLSSTSAIRLHAGGGAAPVTPVGSLPATTQPQVAPVQPQLTHAPEADPKLAGLAITKIFDGQVLLNRGKSSGLRAGDRFKVIRSEQVTDGGGAFQGEREVAVLVIDSLGADSARAQIWRGDRVLPGDHVEPADSNTDPSLMYPRQLHGFLEAEIHLRPCSTWAQPVPAC